MLHVGASNDATYTNIIYMGFCPKNTILLCCTVYHKHVYTHTHTHQALYMTHTNALYITNMCTRTHTKTYDILYSYVMSSEYDAMWYTVQHVSQTCVHAHAHTPRHLISCTRMICPCLCFPCVLHQTYGILYSYDLSYHMSSEYHAIHMKNINIDFFINAGLLSCIAHRHANVYTHARAHIQIVYDVVCAHACIYHVCTWYIITHPDNICTSYIIICVYIIYYHTWYIHGLFNEGLH